MLLEIIAPDQNLYSGEVDLVQVPGSKGSFQILRKAEFAFLMWTAELSKLKTTKS